MVWKSREKTQGYMSWLESGRHDPQVDGDEVRLQISDSNVVRAVKNMPGLGMNSRREDTPSHSFRSVQMITEENALGAALSGKLYDVPTHDEIGPEGF